MRLIFNKEREFLNRELGINIPENSAFMNKMCVKMITNKGVWQTIYRIGCKNEQLILNSDSGRRLNEMEFMTWKDLIKENLNNLQNLENESLRLIKEYISKEEYKGYKYTVPVSGGKDSAIVHYLVSKAVDQFDTVFSNTTNETHHTYKYVKKYYPDAKIITPEEGFYNFVNRTGFIPTRFNRSCCTSHKEMPMIQQLPKDDKILFFMGMRKAESNSRSQYNYLWKNHRWGNREWQGVLPILEWSDIDVLLYMLWSEIPFNPLYTYGFGRVGCTNCCFRSDYELLLNKEFLTSYYDRWQLILEKDFIDNKKCPTLNCSLDEYKKGAWRAGTVRDEATEEIINEFAQQQGLDIKLAKKYFSKTCHCCGKRLKKDDIAMSMKLYGRIIDKFKCLKCIAKDMNCKVKDLRERIKDFKNGGCDLF